MPGKLLEQVRQDERDDEDADEFRDLITQEVEGVISPIVQQLDQVAPPAGRRRSPG
jgi:hypothetical protein